MKILQAINCAVYGGLSLHALTLSRELKARGHEVEVLTMKDGPLVPEFERAGIPLTVIPFEGYELRRHPLLIPQGVLKVRDLIREMAPDVVHTHGPRAHFSASAAARLAGRPVLVASAHGSYTQFIVGHEEEMSATRRGMRKLQFGTVDRMTAALVDCMIAVCYATRNDLVQGLGVSSAKVTVVHNGIEDQNVSPERAAAIRDEFGFDKRHKLAVYVGRIAMHKGSRDLIEAFELVASRVPEARFLIVGEGPMEEELRRRVQEGSLAGKAFFTGSRTDAIDIIAAADLLALPSLSEGLPLTLLEAAMLGRPMVAYEVGGMPEVVRPGETGLLAPVGDAVRFAGAIIDLLYEDTGREQMGLAARALWEKEFTAGKMVDRMESIYAELLAKRQQD
jgi:glycosyltransferase involved in cell wall biosynthesis